MAKRRNKNKKAGPVKVIRPGEQASPTAAEAVATDVEAQVAAPLADSEITTQASESVPVGAALAEDAPGEPSMAEEDPAAAAQADFADAARTADEADPTPTDAEVTAAEAMLADAASRLSIERAEAAGAAAGIEIPGSIAADVDSGSASEGAAYAEAARAPTQPLPEFDDASALLAQAAPANVGAEPVRRSIVSIAIPGASAEASVVDAQSVQAPDSSTVQPAHKADRTLKLKKLKKHVRSIGEPEAEPEPEVTGQDERKAPSEPRIAAFAQLALYQSLSLAHVPGLPEEADVPGHWRGVGFGIGGKRFVAGFEEVVEVIRMPAVTHVPGTQPWMLGVANVRGTLLPVVDLKQFLEGERTVVYEGQRVMVVRQGGGNVAVLIDQLYGQRTFNDSHKVVVPAGSGVRYAHFIKQVYRVGDSDWGVFSMATLTRTPEFRQAAA